MKILIISDIHSNYEALLAVTHAVNADEVWCLGDLVDFGPQPAECVQWVRHHVHRNCVLGNHDYAMAFDDDCQSGAAFHGLSELSRQMNRELLHEEQIEYLRSLPPVIAMKRDGFYFHLSHATPDGDLYKSHLQPDISDASLNVEIDDIHADFICCGHTHLPMIREIGGKIFVNPGSVGMPLDGDPRASYAVFHGGKMTLGRVKYDVGKTVERLCESSLAPQATARLADILHAGRNVDAAARSDLRSTTGRS